MLIEVSSSKEKDSLISYILYPAYPFNPYTYLAMLLLHISHVWVELSLCLNSVWETYEQPV